MDTQVQFNDAGGLAGDTGLTFNKTTDALSIGGALSAAAGSFNGNLTVKYGDIRAVRAGDTSGVIYFSTADKYLYYNGTDFTLNGGGLVVQGGVFGVNAPSLYAKQLDYGTGTFSPDFRANQNVWVRNGSTISGCTLTSGMMGRIFVPGGSVNLPAGWHISRGGAQWGAYVTIISVWTWDGSTILASFTPFDS